MKKGQKLKYIGKGFIGFHKDYTEMIFIEKDGLNDYWVRYYRDLEKTPEEGVYKIGRMLVRKSEVIEA